MLIIGIVAIAKLDTFLRLRIFTNHQTSKNNLGGKDFVQLLHEMQTNEKPKMKEKHVFAQEPISSLAPLFFFLFYDQCERSTSFVCPSMQLKSEKGLQTKFHRNSYFQDVQSLFVSFTKSMRGIDSFLRQINIFQRKSKHIVLC